MKHVISGGKDDCGTFCYWLPGNAVVLQFWLFVHMQKYVAGWQTRLRKTSQCRNTFTADRTEEEISSQRVPRQLALNCSEELGHCSAP